MGVSGLLPFVKNACRKGNISELRGKSVAVDVSCLLHRGLTGCMDKIHMGEDTQSYVFYVEKYVAELLAIGCHVVMVFDGRPLPAKKDTNADRRELREKRKEQADLLLAKGLEREARDILRLATSISADIVHKTIAHFRKRQNIDIVVAPYEADAQLAYLMHAKLVDAVITEDSDLIVFGCEKIYFKWQSATGECSIYEKCNLKKCFTGELGGDKFDFVKFRRICILAGCDYLQAGLPGVGLSTAAKFFSLTSIKDLRTALKKIPSYLKNPKLKEHVTDAFITSFEQAENTFKHQVVFDPRERCQRPLMPYPGRKSLEVVDLENDSAEVIADSDPRDFSYAGTSATQRSAIRLALGNPADGNAIDDKFLLLQPTPDWSVWGLRYESKGSIVEKAEKKKETEAMQCGGAFKLDSPALKRVQKKTRIDEEHDDDIVKQFMEDIEKEKTLIKKRKNAPEVDYSAEKIMKKYAAPPEPKKAKIETVKDDFSEFFEQKEEKKEEEENKKIEPAPTLRKTASTPEPNSKQKLKKFQSPLLTHQNSAPSAIAIVEKGQETSKYFAKKINGTPKVSNPFRCPAFVKPSPTRADSSEKSETREPSLLAALDTENKATTVSTTANYRFVGFKSAGLSRRHK